MAYESNGAVSDDNFESSLGAESSPGIPFGMQMVSSLKARQAKTIYFYRDGEAVQKEIRVALHPNRYRSIDTLFSDLTSKMPDLSYGVRSVFTPRGRTRVSSLEEFSNKGRYICSDKNYRPRGVNFEKLKPIVAWRAVGKASNGLRKNRLLTAPENSKFNRGKPRPSPRSYPGSDTETTPIQHAQASLYRNGTDTKRIYVRKNTEPQKKHVLLLNRRVVKSFEQVMDDLCGIFQMSIHKLYTLDGQPVESISAIFNGGNQLVAGGHEHFRPTTVSDCDDISPVRHNPRHLAKQNGGPVASVNREKRQKLLKTKGNWSVLVITRDDEEEAGTSARVFITVYGRHNHTRAIPLDKSIDGENIDLFHLGRESEFQVSVDNIGEIFKIRMSHDNSGSSPSWFLGIVKMRDVDTGEELNFRFDRWFCRERGDGEICRELPAVRPREKVLSVLKYRVTTVTGDCYNAGTDANVFITIFGELGDSGVRELRRSIPPKTRCFQKGESDTFEVEAVSLGRLKRVIIGHNAKSAGEGWFLEKVVIKESSDTVEQSVFPCSKWLDQGENDGKTTRELNLLEEFMHDVMEKEMWEYERWKFEPGNQIIFYHRSTDKALRVLTNGKVDALGEANEPHAIFSVEPRKGGVFLFRTTGQPSRYLTLDKGQLTGEVKATPYCEFRIRVQPDRSIMLQSAKQTIHHINILKSGLPTDPRGVTSGPGKLFLPFCKGMFREEGLVMFCTSMTQTISLDHDNTLHGTGKRNRLAQFRVHKPSDGVRMFESVVFPNQFIQVKDGQCDCQGVGDSDCHFNVEKFPSQNFVVIQAASNRDLFLGITPDGKVNPTVDTGEKNVRIYPEVIKFGKTKSRAAIMPSPPKSDKPIERRQIRNKPPGPVKESWEKSFSAQDWKVWVESAQSGLRGDIVLHVYDNVGKSSGPLMLGSTVSDKKLFHAGSKDLFKISIPALGSIFKIRVELIPHDVTAPPFWCLKEIILENSSRDDHLRFDFGGRYLSREYDDCELSRELPVDLTGETPDADCSVVHYMVEVETGDVAGADTGSNVYICLFGEKGDCGKRMVYNREEDIKFKRNKIDKFSIEAVYLGPLKCCVVSIDNLCPSEGWFCSKVTVFDPLLKKSVVFFCNKWLDSGMDDGKVERVLRNEGYVPGGEALEEPIVPVKAEKKPVDSLVVMSEDELMELEATAEEVPNNVETIEAQDLVELITEKAAQNLEDIHQNDWQLVVCTGSESDMGAETDISVRIFGDEGHTEICNLKKAEDFHHFRPGTESQFDLVIDSEQVGHTLVKLHLYSHSDVDPPNGWFITRILLHNKKDPEYKFDLSVESWLKHENYVQDALIEIPMDEKSWPVMSYGVTVTHTSLPSSLNDSLFLPYLELIGDISYSGKRPLYLHLKKETEEEEEEEEEALVFEASINSVGLGNLEAICIGGYSLGPNPSGDTDHWEWPIQEIKISNQDDVEWLFIYDKEEQLSSLNSTETLPVVREEKFEIVLLTGEESVAGTSIRGNPIYLTLYGEQDQTEILLQKEDSQFRPGSEECFDIKPNKIGKFLKLRIRVDLEDGWISWLLDKVTVRSLSGDNQEYILPINKSLGNGPNATCSTEAAFKMGDDEDSAPLVLYDIYIDTGNIYGCESDAVPYIHLFGDISDSGQRILQRDINGRRGFEFLITSNSQLHYQVEAIELGDLRNITIGHRLTAAGAGFHLNCVTIGNNENGKQFVFPCCAWLDQGMQEGLIERKLQSRDCKLSSLTSGGFSTRTPREAFNSGRYRVAITTAKSSKTENFSGPIYFTAVDLEGHRIRWAPLLDVLTQEDFQPDRSIEFNIDLPKLGTLEKCEVEIVDPDVHWVVAEMIFTDRDSTLQYRSYEERCFGRASIYSELIQEYSLASSPLVDYYIAISVPVDSPALSSGDIICLTLIGECGSTNERQLLRGVNGMAAQFSPGATTLFCVSAVELGELTQVTLRALRVADNTKDLIDWYPACISVQIGLLNWQENLFENQFDEKLDDDYHLTLNITSKSLTGNYITRETLRSALLRHTWPSAPPPSNTHIKWRVELWTNKESDLDFDYSSSPVELCLCGTIPSTSPEAHLLTQAERDPDLDHKYIFTVETENIGDLIKLRLLLKSNHAKPVKIERVKLMEPITNQIYLFVISDWLEPNLPIELAATRPGVPPSKSILYRVSFDYQLPANREHLPANLTCCLRGELGDSGHRSIREMDDHYSIWSLEFLCIDLGRVTQLIIGHTESGRGNGIFIETASVDYKNLQEEEVFFKSFSWLDESWGDGRLKVILNRVEDLSTLHLISYDLFLTLVDRAEVDKCLLALNELSPKLKLMGIRNSEPLSTDMVDLKRSDKISDKEDVIILSFSAPMLDKVSSVTLFKSDSNMTIDILETGVRHANYSPVHWISEAYISWSEECTIDITNWEPDFISKSPLNAQCHQWRIVCYPMVTEDPGSLLLKFGGDGGESEVLTAVKESDNYVVQYDTLEMGNLTVISLSFKPHQEEKTWDFEKIEFHESQTDSHFILKNLALRPYDWLMRQIIWPGCCARAMLRYEIRLTASSEHCPVDTWTQFLHVQFSSKVGHSPKLCVSGQKGFVAKKTSEEESSLIFSLYLPVEMLDLGRILSFTIDFTAQSEDINCYIEDIELKCLQKNEISYFFSCKSQFEGSDTGEPQQVVLYPSNQIL